MTVFADTAAVAYGISTAIVCLVLFYLRSMPEAPPGVAWWASAIVASGLRKLALLLSPLLGDQWAWFYADALQAATALLMVGGTAAFLHRPPRHRLLMATWLFALAWASFFLVDGANPFARSAALSAVSGLAVVYTGWVFLRAEAPIEAAGYRLAGAVFLLWGLFWFAEPALQAKGWMKPWGDLAAQGLVLAAGMAIVFTVLQRLRQHAVNAEAEARASHRRAQSIIDATPDGMMIAHAGGGQLLYANRRAAEQLGVPMSEILTRSLPGFFADSDAFAATLEQLQRRNAVDGTEVRLRTARGKPFWALVSVRPIDFDQQPAVLLTFADISKRKALEEQLLRLATTDSLTGAFSRRHYLEMTERELKRARRYQHPVSLLLLDIDHFKRINDTYGHAKGDHVLRVFAAHCRGALRAHDFLGRLGGEEFAVTLPQTDVAGALEIAERLRQTFTEQAIPDPRGMLTFTVSIGVVECLPQDDVETALQRADTALYRAKSRGRNRVCGPEDNRGASFAS